MAKDQRVSPSTKPATGSLSALEPSIARVYNLCARMTLAKGDAERATYQTFRRAVLGEVPDDERTRELWLLKIAAHVIEQVLTADPEVDFDLLDDTLRSEATRTNEVASLTSPQREFLLWELKQGCMTSVINCLSPGERVAFVFSSVLGKSDEEAAVALGIKESAFKVRLSRARKKIGDYLAPRCEHVDPRNPCHCPSRIGVALRKGFIGKVSGEVSLRKGAEFPYGRYGTGLGNDDVPMRDISAIYGGLPEPDPPADLGERLVGLLSA